MIALLLGTIALWSLLEFCDWAMSFEPPNPLRGAATLAAFSGSCMGLFYLAWAAYHG